MLSATAWSPGLGLLAGGGAGPSGGRLQGLLQVGLRAGQENNSDVFYPKYTSSDQHSQPQCSAEGFCPSLLPRGSAHLGVLMLICDFRAMHDLGLRIKAGTLTFRQPSEKGEPLKCLKEDEKAPLSPFDRMASSLPGFSG